MFEKLTLDNGLPLILVPINGIRSVSIGIYVNIGSRYETDGEAGAAHFIEHLLFKGTPRRPSAQLIAEAIEGIGGHLNASTDPEITMVWAKVAGHHFVEAVDVLIDMVRHSTFAPPDVERERQVILEELKMYYDNPDDWVDTLLNQTLWPNHPLGKDIAGRPETVAALERQALRAFYERAYHPQNMVVVVAGYFDDDAVVAALQSRTQDWPPHPSLTFEPAPKAPLSVRFACEDRPIEQGHLNLGAPGLHRHHPDRFTLAILNTILGSGMSSRLFLKLREELGLAYDIGSTLTTLADTGALIIYGGVDPTRAVEALQAIKVELGRLAQTPVPQVELDKAREYLKGNIILSLENSIVQASWYGQQALLYPKIRTIEEILAEYDAVTAADVQQVAQQLFDPARFVLAAVGPFGQGEALAEILG